MPFLNTRFLGVCLRASAALLVLALAGTPLAFSQIQAGRIVGTVFDPARAVVPGATVVVTNVDTNVERRVTSNAVGDYVVAPLNPGIYNISAGATGFQTTVQTGVEVVVGQDLRLDFQLDLGDTATTVEIVADVPIINTESGDLGHVITNKQINDLPLNGRGFNELARLTPGVVLLTGTGNVNRIRPEFVNGTTVSGVRGNQVSFYVDGVDTTEQHQGGSWIQTSIDGLQEFSLQQNAYSAEHSRSGSFFNVTTKAGTNRLHGSLFEFLRNDKMDARNFFADRKEVLKRNQYGATVGGPVYLGRLYDGRNRTFFQVTYEAQRERQGTVINNTAPTQAMLDGNFQGLAPIFDPYTTEKMNGKTTRQPFANNIIPGQLHSAVAKYFNPYIPLATSADGFFRTSQSRGLDTDQITVRIDQNLSASHKLFGRLSYHDHRLDDPNSAPALGNADMKTWGRNIAVSLSSNLSPTLINEARFNLLQGIIDLQPFLPGTDFNAESGITGLEITRRSYDTGSFPDFAWSGYASVRGSAFDQRPKTQDRDTVEFLENLTWIKGRHLVKFGGKMRFYQWLGTDSKEYMGNWSFNGQNTQNPASSNGTGESFADWVLGLPRSGARGFPSDTFGGHYYAWHFFVQDDIRVSNRLTLNLGLRYEYTPWTTPYRGQTGTFDGTLDRPLIVASKTNQIDLGAQPAAPIAYEHFGKYIQTSTEAGLPYTVTQNDTNQWGPRLGFAWRPIGERTVLRGGFGMYYEGESTSGRANLFMPPFLLRESITADVNTLPTRTLQDFFLGVQLGSPDTIIGLTPDYVYMKIPTDMHWNFGVQHQLTRTAAIDIEYVANRGFNLHGNNAFNIPDAGPGSVQPRRPYPKFSGFSYIMSDRSSTYHALQIKFDKRLSNGLWFLTSYTFSKNIWAQQTTGVGGRFAYERGPSSTHVPHSFTFSFGYEMPFGKGRPYLSNAHPVTNALLGGWSVQGIWLLRSGIPFTPSISRDQANIGTGGQRPNRIGDGRLDNPTLDRWFDVDAFEVPDQYTYGNSGLRIIPPDMHRTYDFSVFKEFQVTESSKFQFRAEAFNLPNTPSFSAPQSNIQSSSAGKVTSTTTNPRQMQLALKYIF